MYKTIQTVIRFYFTFELKKKVSTRMVKDSIISKVEFLLTNIVGYNPDELIYFSLTSKIEFQLRDRIAFHLYNELKGKYIVTREWQKCDLAILDKESLKPICLIECKACYGFDLINDGTLKEYVNAIKKDFEKSKGIADKDTEIFSILFLTKPTHSIPENLLSIIKYSKSSLYFANIHIYYIIFMFSYPSVFKQFHPSNIWRQQTLDLTHKIPITLVKITP